LHDRDGLYGAQIVAIWHPLSDAVKNAILDLVRAADPIRRTTADGN
jgi:hypothetical protein